MYHIIILSTHTDRQRVDMLVTVCLFFVCVFVRLRISPQGTMHGAGVTPFRLYFLPCLVLWVFHTYRQL